MRLMVRFISRPGVQLTHVIARGPRMRRMVCVGDGDDKFSLLLSYTTHKRVWSITQPVGVPRSGKFPLDVLLVGVGCFGNSGVYNPWSTCQDWCREIESKQKRRAERAYGEAFYGRKCKYWVMAGNWGPICLLWFWGLCLPCSRLSW